MKNLRRDFFMYEYMWFVVSISRKDVVTNILVFKSVLNLQVVIFLLI